MRHGLEAGDEIRVALPAWIAIFEPNAAMRTWFPSSPLKVRVPFFLLFGFNK